MSCSCTSARVLVFLAAGCTPAPEPGPGPDAGTGGSLAPSNAASPVARHFSPPKPALPAPSPLPDPRTPAELSQAACRRSDGSWACKGIAPKAQLAAASGQTPILPPSWTVPAWFIDGANSTTCAADTNNCTSGTCGAIGSGVGPCLTWNEIDVHRWGCSGSPASCARLRQNTSVSILSNLANSDAIYVRAAPETGVILSFTCSLGAAQTIGTGTLGNFTARNRAANQVLQGSVGALVLSNGYLLQNTTHPSRALPYKVVAGNTWQITQPFAAFVIGSFLPTPVNTWTPGDSITVYQPISVNFAAIQPSWADNSSTVLGLVTINQCTLVDPLGLAFGIVYESILPIGHGIMIGDSVIQRGILGSSNGFFNVQNSNDLGGLISSTAYTIAGTASGQAAYIGGSLGAGSAIEVTAHGWSIDGDTILNAGVEGDPIGLGQSFIGTAYIDTGYTLSATDDVSMVDVIIPGEGGPILYGPGTFNASGHSRVVYPAGAGAAALAFPLTGGLRVNAQTKACIAQPAAGAIGACNTTVTASNLDINAGATSGCLATIGGGAFCNYGQ
jgi:hypothetical protein